MSTFPAGALVGAARRPPARASAVRIFPWMLDEKRARWSNTVFLIGFAGTAALFVWVLRPFLVTLVMAASGASILAPVQDRLARLLGGRRVLAAWICTLVTVVLVLGPLTWIAIRVVIEAVPAVRDLADTLGEGGLARWLQTEAPLPLREGYAWVVEMGLGEQARDLLGSIAGALAGVVGGLPSFLALLLTDGLVLVVMLVWFLSAGPFLVSRLVESIPMEPRYTRDLLRTMAAGVRTIILASLLTAAIQGVLGFGAFYLLKLPYPLLLAAVMAFFSFVFSLVPVLGSGLVWGPAAVWLFVQGRVVAGIFLFVWGFLVLGSVDNVVKPFFTKGSLQLPPALVFTAIFGGLAAFGPIGALLGPLVAAAVGAFVRIWREDFLRLPPLEESGGGPMPPHLPPTPYDREGRLVEHPEPPPDQAR